MDISKWNKVMESFQKLLGWDDGMNMMTEIRRNAYGKMSILDIESKDERRLMHRLRRAYDRAKQYKESI